MLERARSVQRQLREFEGQLRKMLPLVEGLLQADEVLELEAASMVSQKAGAARPADRRFRIERYGLRASGRSTKGMHCWSLRCINVVRRRCGTGFGPTRFR